MPIFSPKRDKYIIVMYHYIFNERPDRRGMHPRRPADFATELDFLTAHYQIVTVPEVSLAARQNGPPSCALTFDDATRDQYEKAAPRLETKGCRGTFFVISSVLDGVLPITHGLHVLLSYWSGKQVVDRYHRFLEQNGKLAEREQLIIPTNHHLNPLRLHDDVYTANFKEFFPSLPVVWQRKFLTATFQELHLNPQVLTAELFMQAAEIQDLTRRGHVIGAHAHQHRPFDLLTQNEITVELTQSQKILAKILGITSSVISYPYGRLPVQTAPILAIVKKTVLLLE